MVRQQEANPHLRSEKHTPGENERGELASRLRRIENIRERGWLVMLVWHTRQYPVEPERKPDSFLSSRHRIRDGTRQVQRGAIHPLLLYDGALFHFARYTTHIYR